MAERAGLGNALRYLLTGDEFDAKTALRLGFVQEIVAPEELHTRAMALATSIAAQAPLAVSATLSNTRKAVFAGPSSALAELGQLQATLRETEDAAEGVRSFIEKRAGRFSGR
jgi:enoyl-CoA hydratase/carnithine racemase